VQAKSKRPGQRKKRIEEVVEYAVSHKMRVLVLSLLNEGVYSAAEIAAILDEPEKNVRFHVKELLDAGSIELARTEKVRNTDRHYYRAVEMPFYSDEEVWAMTPHQRQVSAGIVIQNLQAEIMAAFWAGKIRDDPQTWLAWRWFNVDAEGREAIAEEQQRSWDRMVEIEAEATNRRAQSGEGAKSIIVGAVGFERERTAPKAPSSMDAD
jgi:DNA-binding transcriptional ArsR family regulator